MLKNIDLCLFEDFFKIVHFSFFLFSSLVNLHGYSVQVFEYSETCTDIVRRVRSGGYAHDFHSTEVRAQTVETVTAFV